MNIIFQIFPVIIVAVGIFFALLKLSSKNENKSIFKILSICLIVAFFFRYMLGNETIRDTILLENEKIGNKLISFVAIILTWLNICSNLILMLYPFSKSKKINQNNLVATICFPVAVLTLIGIYPYTMGIVSKPYTNFDVRIIFLSLEIAISLAYSSFIFYKNYKNIKKEDIKKILKLLPVLLLATMPAYTLQGLFGTLNIYTEIKNLTYIHRCIIYLAFILPVVIYVLLRKKDREVIDYILLFISLGTMISFTINHRFDSFKNIATLPLDILVITIYLIPICLVTKYKKLFNFVYFVCAPIILLSMFVPTYSAGLGLFSTNLVLFYTGHYASFFLPILFVGLKEFDIPSIKDFRYSIIVFVCYFFVILMVNTIANNFNPLIDFLFLNTDYLAEIFGAWAVRLRDISKVSISITSNFKLIFYPLYQFIIFLCYVLVCFIIMFAYEEAYKIKEHIKDMYGKKKEYELLSKQLQDMLRENYMQERIYKEGQDKVVISGFKKKYGQSDSFAVNGIDLTINAGEIFGFLGPNGAGKSSTIKCLVGIQELTDGKMFIDGYDIQTQPVEAKKEIGFVPDHYALYEKLTGREYVNYIADIYGVPKNERKQAIDYYVELFDLGKAFDNPIKTYSHGMKQKITIIQALCHNPKLWILDEPLTGLDPNSIRIVKDCMIEHAKKGNIVFFSSHIIDIVEKLCDKIAIIKKGKIVAVCDMKEIQNNNISLEEFYLEKINSNDDEVPSTEK